MKTNKNQLSKKETEAFFQGLLNAYNQGEYTKAFYLLRSTVHGKYKRGIDVPGLTKFVSKNLKKPSGREQTYQALFHQTINIKKNIGSCYEFKDSLFDNYPIKQAGKGAISQFISHMHSIATCLPKAVQEKSRLPLIDSNGANALHYLLIEIDDVGTTDLTDELKQGAVFAWAVFYDIQLLKYILDGLLFDESYLLENKEFAYNTWFPEAPKFPHFNRLKNEFRWQVQQQLHKTDVDGEAHFQEVDPVLKTNEGLAVLAVTKGTLISSNLPAGTTYLQADVDFQEDPSVTGQTMWYRLVLQHFHTYYRRRLQRFYQPKEFDKLKDQKITHKGTTFSVHEIMALSSLIMAASEMLRDHPQFSAERLELEHQLSFLCEKEPIENVDILLAVNIESAFSESKLALWPHTSIELTEKVLLQQIRRIEDFRSKKDSELSGILDYLISNKIHQGFFKTKDTFLFDTNSVLSIDYAAHTHLRMISGSLYSDKTNKGNGTRNARKRETGVIEQVTDLFGQKGFKVIAHHNYLCNHRNTSQGEMDLLVLSEKEKTGLVFELKLSNSGAHDTRTRIVWTERNLPVVTNQLQKDRRYLSRIKRSNTPSLENYDITGYRFHYFALTDHFFFDHLSLKLTKDRIKAIMVSTFELRCLLDDQYLEIVGDKLPNKTKNLQKLAVHLKQNFFWKNVLPEKDNYKKSSSILTKKEMELNY